MRIEPPVEEKVKPKRKYSYVVSVNSSYDRPTLMKMLWKLDEDCVMSARSNWTFKIRTVLTTKEMTSIMANCGFLCKFRKALFW